jgi:arabinofuranan 3-O-arabinosyltransferase
MRSPHGRLARFVLNRRVRYAAAWLLALGCAGGRLINGYYSFHDPRPVGHPERRLDGNKGHISIDFGGSWLMGRMLARGHGRELYSRPRYWEVAQQAYPVADQAPAAAQSDAAELLQQFMGDDDPRWGDFAGAVGALAGATDPFQRAALAVQGRAEWDEKRLSDLTRPKRINAGLGGPLYPPIQAFLMLPFALGDHPQRAYFVMQWLQTFLCVLAGVGVGRLSGGRFWSPLAASLILLYPGSRGVIDLGQNSALTLCLLVWGWVLLARGRPAAAGVLWGGLAYKPVWALTFFLLLVLLRRWRMALAMGVTGAALALATVPVVGVETWLNWLKVGQRAAVIYNVDANWIPLSRDLLGVPRRFFLDFSKPREERDNLTAMVLGWALWAVVLEITLRVFTLRGRREVPFTGPLPAFLILAGWMCTYHFMYYDALISAFGVCVLLADPRPFFRARAFNREAEAADPFADPPPRRSVWLLNSFVLTVVALLLFHENVTEILKLEATAVVRPDATTRRFGDGTTELAPRLVIGSGDHYPWDTFMVMALWAWCGVAVLAGWASPPGAEGNKSNSATGTSQPPALPLPASGRGTGG